MGLTKIVTTINLDPRYLKKPFNLHPLFSPSIFPFTNPRSPFKLIVQDIKGATICRTLYNHSCKEDKLDYANMKSRKVVTKQPQEPLTYEIAIVLSDEQRAQNPNGIQQQQL
jgi:hypothetical protein